MLSRPNRHLSKSERHKILDWLRVGIFRVVETCEDEGTPSVAIQTQSGTVLRQRNHFRQRSQISDLRVDLCYDNRRATVNVSHLVWMLHTDQLLPESFEIHHLDENTHNNQWSNLVAVHALDHLKFHQATEEVPF